MQDSALHEVFRTLLIQHDSTVRAVCGELSNLAGSVQDERLAVWLESYLQQTTEELRDSEKLLAQKRLKPRSADDQVIACLLLEGKAAEECEAPPEILALLLARVFLRIQHCQIATLGVLQMLAEELEDADALGFVRDAMDGEIEAEETLSILLENELVPDANT